MCLLTAFTHAGAQPAESLEGRVKANLWKKRVILVYARDENNADLLAQKRLLADNKAGLTERDFTELVVLESNLSTDDRTYLRAGDRKLGTSVAFMAFLIGKDGGVKQRYSKPVTAAELFRIVDSMPMRQSEMRRNK
ncbi:DUF4174 domain-containing protein [Fibrella aquatica]|uniref:DUF4174 domain-containing protein n=1 Tax=Fibrella aquatica TaxID=3242487 RepID=UPI003521A4CA